MPFARPLPIALVVPSFQPGGTERQMIELLRRLDRRRWEVHLACFRGEGPWFARAAETAASVAEFPIEGFARTDTVMRAREFARWCRERAIAVVHTSDFYSNIFFLPGAALGRVPVRIGSRREIAAGKSPTQLACQRAAYAFAHRVLANAEAVAVRLRREGVPSDRIAVVPNGLDVDRFVPRVLPSRLRRVVMVAGLRPGKGHDALIDAAPAILGQFPDAQFELVGDGPERAALEHRAVQRGVAGAFTFSGHAEDVAARLADADVFVLPSESEAFPNAVLEAMAAGLPVVATAVGGLREVVEHDETGLLVPPQDPRQLAGAVCRLMAAPALAQALATRGRARVEARYSYTRMVTSIEQLYDRELTRRAPERAVQSQFASL